MKRNSMKRNSVKPEFDEAEFRRSGIPTRPKASMRDHRRRPPPQPPREPRRIRANGPYSSPLRRHAEAVPISGAARVIPRVPFARRHAPFTALSRPYRSARPFQWPGGGRRFSSQPYATQQLPGPVLSVRTAPLLSVRTAARSSRPSRRGWGPLRVAGAAGLPYRQPRYSTYSDPSYYDEPSYARTAV